MLRVTRGDRREIVGNKAVKRETEIKTFKIYLMFLLP